MLDLDEFYQNPELMEQDPESTPLVYDRKLQMEHGAMDSRDHHEIHMPLACNENITAPALCSVDPGPSGGAVKVVPLPHPLGCIVPSSMAGASSITSTRRRISSSSSARMYERSL